MTRQIASVTSDALPPTLPIFPLQGVLLLPRGRLPLNVFEPRYLALIEDALAGDRLVGMIQPLAGEHDRNDPPVYRTGGAGRITSFHETDDGRYLVTLTGLCRFLVTDELPPVRGYRQAHVSWAAYHDDLASAIDSVIDRRRLLANLKVYFGVHGIHASWESIDNASDDRLVSTLAMVCPFEPNEKQALLEAPTLAERGRLLTTLIEMAILEDPDGASAARH